MTNHNPTITSSAATGSFSETSNTTGSSAAHILSGTMNFTDSDRSDTHTTSASLKTAVASGGTVVPSASLSAFNSAMSSVIQSDSNGSGKLKWTFSAADNKFDFLAKNQTLILTYEVKVNDNHGGTTKKTVTVTVTGTDDKPVIEFGADAVLTERPGQSLSLAPDTANIAVSFVDVDLANTGHTATVIDVTATGATGGILPGYLGELELMSFFRVNNVVKASGSSNGTINTTFSAPDLAFDYLSAGETIDIVYTLRLDDRAGGISTQTVLVTVVGTNDGPKFIGGPESAHLEEGENVSPSGDLTANGDLLFGDIDLSDTHSVSTTVTATRSGGGAVPLTNAELLAALSTSLDDSTGQLLGEVDWNFALDNDAVNFLNSGETLTLTYNITITDGAGGTATQTVTVTILGTNDPVVISSGPGSATLVEFADTTGSSAQNTTSPVPTDSLAFTDTDVSDTHTVNVSLNSAVWSGGSVLPAATQTSLGAALLTTLNDSTGTGSGSVDWTFSIADQDLDFLAAGETLTVEYDVEVRDGSTGSSQTVTVTVDGANDAPLITSGPGSASLTEFANTTGSAALNSTSPVPTGTLTFTDADLTDSHDLNVVVASYIWSGGPDVPFVIGSDIATALATTLDDSTGSGSGSVDWSFSIPDRDLDFLAAGETLTVTYEVALSDAWASSTQTVTITINGAEDPLTVNPLTASLADTVFQDIGTLVAAGNLITDAGDTGGDLSTTLSITEVNGQASNVEQFIGGAYGNLYVATDGFYFYIANSNLDPLQAGDSTSEQFDFTVTDNLGRSETTTLTFNVTGANDGPTITAADTGGSITEDLGPTVVVNGDFETGDLSGWTASSSSIEAQFVGAGGELGQVTVRLGSAGSVQTLSQDVSTTPGQHYTVSFLAAGDPESTSNELVVTWDGETMLVVSDEYSGGFTRYTFDVVGNATNPTTSLLFAYYNDGVALYLDQVVVAAAAGPATASADGSLSFADIEAADTHTASFVPQGGDYLGTFSLDSVVEGGGSGSVGWHFTVDNADIQFLSSGQSLVQIYTVFITDAAGAAVPQDVSVTINGTNDAPTVAVADTVITNVDENGGVFIPGWALGANDIDPDTADTLTLNDVLGSSGGDAFEFGGALFFDDATLGGSFTYDATDGFAVTPAGTVTVVNNSASLTTLTGTSGNDIIIAVDSGVALDGADGDDILIGYGDSHVLTGGDGDDTFAFEIVPGAASTIADFDNTTAIDMISVSASGFGGGLVAGMDLSSLFESSADNQFFLGYTRFHYDETNGALYFSSDGTNDSALLLAQFQPGVQLDSSDLFIV